MSRRNWKLPEGVQNWVGIFWCRCSF